MHHRRSSEANSIARRAARKSISEHPVRSPQELCVSQEEVMKEGQLSKLCAGGKNNWQARIALLTDTDFFLVMPDHPLVAWALYLEFSERQCQIRDVIPLHEITAVNACSTKVFLFCVVAAHIAEHRQNRPNASSTDISLAMGRSRKGNFFQRSMGNLLPSFNSKDQTDTEANAHCFVVTTEPAGSNTGNAFYLRAPDVQEMESWMAGLSQAAKRRVDSMRAKHEAMAE
eukprot:760622-Hanusia_phi.AAC.3